MSEDESPPDYVSGQLWLAGGLNQRMIALLTAIEQVGSINRAAKVVGLSYKGAWEMVERANNLAPRALVETGAGAGPRGGTRLTDAGRRLLELYRYAQLEQQRFLLRLNREIAADAALKSLFRRIAMQASARNQLFGKVVEIKPGATNAEVAVELKGGARLIAAITMESLSELGVHLGAEVAGLIKAPQVMLVTDFGGYRLSARNQLAGTVSRIQPGAVNSEVVVELPGGDTLAATVTQASLEAMGLKIGAPITAVFKAGAVILGVAEK